ncbi:hypothetical protein FIV42_12140 [Persicimonas caeni]|uniref:Uncharacterized protein n=1 Tax=Persicimonas caeni TaxID=2292766 RepID=A0A4Y6PTX0_PERCE|nr:hypothetical protein [Persicimonas caeni]QDG51467.1 hypothetical protein FIV42_12140 [Persicimonas caeni]QED32688.1 hypothetical protein FRD00_12135 [Persicimonas caeni]
MADKLHIPGPDEQDEPWEMDITLVIAWGICMLICIGLFLLFRGRMPEPEPPKPEDPVKARQVELLDRARFGGNDFETLEFSDKDAVAVFRHGPREAAEAACRDLKPVLESGGLSHTLHLELLKTVDRRAEHAPWTCLVRSYLAREISADLDLFGELGEFWQETRAFKTSPTIVSSVLEEFRRSRNRPEHAQFYAWLRLCGLHPLYAASPDCQKILYQISPAQGEDALGAVEKHFQEVEPEALREDMKIIVPALGELSQKGQPKEWRVEMADGIANYEASFRIGATFVLCRIVNSPDDRVARAAAVEVAETATVGARATDENLLRRWRESCGLAFQVGQGDEDAEAGEADEAGEAEWAPALAVWNGQKDQPPNYALAWARERGDCPDDGRPAWACGLDLWQGAGQELDMALMNYFTETRYIEWAGE